MLNARNSVFKSQNALTFDFYSNFKQKLRAFARVGAYGKDCSSQNPARPPRRGTLCVILAANAVKTKRLRISEPSFYHFIFLKNLYNKSILFEQRIGIASKRVSSSHSHHFISCNFWMSSSLNLFFINLAGFPPTIE